MPSGGHNKRPTLAVVREGNPGHRPIRDGVTLPPTALVEPDWSELLPGRSAENKHTRATAARLWASLAPVLARSVGLVHEQQETLIDYCLTWAGIEQCTRAISRQGLVVEGAHGMVKNPHTTVLNQYRAHARALATSLGLTPAAAARLTRPAIDDEDDPFDA